MQKNYNDFLDSLILSSSKFSDFFSNVFTLREIGNKTHGDMAEIGITEFINTYVNGYSAIHVGKDLFRKKTQEEDVIIINDITQEEIPVSVKAYGKGPLQLSTDKDFTIYPLLESFNKNIITDINLIKEICTDNSFTSISSINVLPLIYDETKMACRIMVFDFDKVKNQIIKIEKILPSGQRKHPIYAFYDQNNNYLFEVRYGGKEANALQRGVWTNTNKAEKSFLDISNGWIKYQVRQNLLDILFKLMVATERTEEEVKWKLTELNMLDQN